MTARVLITGATGFVGPFAAAAIKQACGGDTMIIPTARAAGEHATLGAVHAVDVTDQAAVRAAIALHRPTHVLNLAAIAAPADAAADPDTAWDVHLGGVRHLAEAILELAPCCWLLQVGSGLVYGASANAGTPMDETTLLDPVDVYGSTKAAADLALGAYARQGLNCVRFRPFNHTGPGQSEAFVVPAFAMQIARIEAGLAPPVLRVGDLTAERDFLDIRDVARAYALAVAKSSQLDRGEILNVASGTACSIKRLLDILTSCSRAAISIETDHQRLKSSGLPRIVGSPLRIGLRLGWAPHHSFEDALGSTLTHSRRCCHPETFMP